MSTPAQRAAFRLASSLPKKTHHWQPTIVQWGIKRTAAERDQLATQLREAEAAGMTRQQMKAAFRISQHTIEDILGFKK